MRALLLFGHPIGLGGHFNSGLAMVRYLCQAGHQVQVASAGGNPGKIQEFIAAGATVHRVEALQPHSMVFPRRAPIQALVELALVSQVDVVHAMDYQALAPAYTTALHSHAGLVSTFPGGNLFHHVPVSRGQMVVFSQEQIDNLQKRYTLDTDNLHLIPGRIDTTLYNDLGGSQPLEPLPVPQLPASSRIVLMATRFHPAKRRWFHALMDAARQLNSGSISTHFFIAGDGEMATEIQQQADALTDMLGCQVIHLLGPHYQSSVLNGLYNRATVVIGSGRGIMEAMAVGKPVVIINGRGKAHLVDNQCIDAVAYANFSGRHMASHCQVNRADYPGDDLGAVLETLLSSPETLQRAGEFSRSYITSCLDYRVGGEQLAGVYARAMKAGCKWSDFHRWYLRSMVSGLQRIPVALRNRFGKN